MSYMQPMTRVFQEFEQLPSLLVRNLLSCQIGPVYDLVRFFNEDEKENGALVEFSAEETTLSIPGLGGNSTVVPETFRVYGDNVLTNVNKGTMLDNKTVLVVPDIIDPTAIIFDNKLVTGQDNAIVFPDNTVLEGTDMHRAPEVGDYVVVKQTSPGTQGQLEDWSAQVTDLLHEFDDAETGNVTSSDTFDGFNEAAITLAVSSPDRDASGEAYTAAALDVSASPEVRAKIAKYGISDVGTTGLGFEMVILDVSGDVITAQWNHKLAAGRIVDTVAGFAGGVVVDDMFTLTHTTGTISKNDKIVITAGNVSEDAVTNDLVVSVKVPDQFNLDTDTEFSLRVTTGVDATGGDNGGLGIITITSNNPEIPKATYRIPDWDVDAGAMSFELDLATSGITLVFDCADITAPCLLMKGETFVIAGTAKAATNLRGVQLDRDFPYAQFMANAVDTAELDLQFAQATDGVEIPPIQEDGVIVNWTLDGREVTLESAMQVYSEEFDAEVDIGNAPGFNMFYTEYKAFNAEFEGQVMTVTSVTDPRIGTIDPENPVGYAVSKALLNSNGAPVRVAVAEEEFMKFASALDLLTMEGDCHGLVPLTTDVTLQDLVIYHGLDMSTAFMGRWRRSWISSDVGSEYPVLVEEDDASTLLAGFKDTDADGTVNELILDIGSGATFADVKAGHVVRFNYAADVYGNMQYAELVVAQVPSPTKLIVLGSVPVETDSIKIEIWKDTTPADVIEKFGNRAGGLNTRRVSLVAPSVAKDTNNVVVPGMFVCSALAGLASGVPPHQSLTNLTLAGFDSMKVAPFSGFGVTAMNKLAGKGVTLITGEGGNIGIRHSITTDMSDVKNREEMVTRNLDSISYTFLDALAPFIGRSNVNPEFLSKLRTDLQSVSNFIISSSRTANLGSQMIDCEIGEIEQDETLKDTVRMHLKPNLPYPFNYADLYLWVK